MIVETMPCWSCGEKMLWADSDLGPDWYKCTNCGATHVEKPTVPVGAGEMAIRVEASGMRSYKPIKRRK